MDMEITLNLDVDATINVDDGDIDVVYYEGIPGHERHRRGRLLGIAGVPKQPQLLRQSELSRRREGRHVLRQRRRKIGGASGVSVDVGDAAICKADNAGGTRGQRGRVLVCAGAQHRRALLSANNLGDLADNAAARDNLGLGTMAQEAAEAYLPIGGGTLTGALTVNGPLLVTPPNAGNNGDDTPGYDGTVVTIAAQDGGNAGANPTERNDGGNGGNLVLKLAAGGVGAAGGSPPEFRGNCRSKTASAARWRRSLQTATPAS